MIALLDTHAFLWWILADRRISTGALAIIQNTQNKLYLSAASGWEIATKVSIGKMPLPKPPELFIPEQMDLNAVHPLPVSMEHALKVTGLPLIHRDPFDRILVAQSQVESIPIITADPSIGQYAVSVIW